MCYVCGVWECGVGKWHRCGCVVAVEVGGEVGVWVVDWDAWGRWAWMDMPECEWALVETRV